MTKGTSRTVGGSRAASHCSLHWAPCCLFVPPVDRFHILLLKWMINLDRTRGDCGNETEAVMAGLMSFKPSFYDELKEAVKLVWCQTPNFQPPTRRSTMERHWKSEFMPVNWEHINLCQLHKVCKSHVNKVFRFPDIKSAVCYIPCHFLLHLVYKATRLHCWRLEETSFCLSAKIFVHFCRLLMSTTWGCDERILTAELVKRCTVVFFLLTEENRCKSMFLPWHFIVTNSLFSHLPAETMEAALSDQG